MSTHRLSLLLGFMSLASCTGCPPETGRLFPLLPWCETRSDLVRVDIDSHRSAPPPPEFEVDCSALPCAKGEERDFCYKWGSWCVLRHEQGIIVACSCGEFGGFVLWYKRDGTLLQTLIAGDQPQTLIADDGALLCVTGITHLSISKGGIQSFRLVDGCWHVVASRPLPKDIDSISIEPDGSRVFELSFDGGVYRYRAGCLQPLPPATPAQLDAAADERPRGRSRLSVQRR